MLTCFVLGVLSHNGRLGEGRQDKPGYRCCVGGKVVRTLRTRSGHSTHLYHGDLQAYSGEEPAPPRYRTNQIANLPVHPPEVPIYQPPQMGRKSNCTD